ncbi:MAG: phosphatase PAP2 family protein [Patescibacteria group bacterium]
MYEIDVAILWWANSWVFWRDWADTVIIFRAVFLGWWALAALLAFGVFTIPPLVSVFPSFRALRKKNWEMVAVSLSGALIARFGAVELIRFFYDRPRPFEVLTDIRQLLQHEAGGSFPSGHAAFYFAIAAVVSRYYPKTSLPFFGAAFSLSLSRVVAGLHWPTDILGGAIIGIAVGLLTHWLTKKYRDRSAS